MIIIYVVYKEQLQPKLVYFSLRVALKKQKCFYYATHYSRVWGFN